MSKLLRLFPLSRLREREGPAAQRWEGEGLLSSSTAQKKKKEDPHPTLSRKRERAMIY
jgi:hypothetical protein